MLYERTESLTAVALCESGKGGVSGYATLIVAVPCHHNIATHPPIASPAVEHRDLRKPTTTLFNFVLPVLDYPVVLISGVPIPHNQHGMVHIQPRATRCIIDSLLIKLYSHTHMSIMCDVWLLGKSCAYSY